MSAGHNKNVYSILFWRFPLVYVGKVVFKLLARMAKNLLVYSRAVSVYKRLLYEGVLLHVYTKRKCKEILVGVSNPIKMFCKKVEKYYVD